MNAATEISDENKSVLNMPVPILTVLFFPKAAISNIYQGRSSDLLPSFAAFPFLLQNSGVRLQKVLNEAYKIGRAHV